MIFGFQSYVSNTLSFSAILAEPLNNEYEYECEIIKQLRRTIVSRGRLSKRRLTNFFFLTFTRRLRERRVAGMHRNRRRRCRCRRVIFENRRKRCYTEQQLWRQKERGRPKRFAEEKPTVRR